MPKPENAIPEKPENDQEQGSNNADKSEQNLTICKENDQNFVKWHKTKESNNWQYNNTIFFVTGNGPESMQDTILQVPKLWHNGNSPPNL